MKQHKRLAFVCSLLAVSVVISVAAFADGPNTASPVRSAGLDLSTPPLRHLFSARQMAVTDTDAAETPMDTVTVRHSRDPVPCCGTYIALPWAFTHPLHAWRIFAPVTGPCRGMWCTE